MTRQWQNSFAELSADQHKLRLIAQLQSRHRSEFKENELVIENLRELLPSRLKKFAEEIFTYQQGLALQILIGGGHDRAFKNFQSFLKRLESRS